MRNLLLLILLLLAALPARAFPQYHDISDTPAAQAEASQRHLPIAYLGSFPESLTNGSPETGSIDDLTQMALAALQDHAVVVFFDGRNMAPVPPLIHEQYHQQDDGPLDNGANWVSPKIVFCNADISKILGRVSYTQMKASRDVEINSALQVIRNDPHALDAPAPSAPAAAAVPAPNAPASPGAPAGASDNVISTASWVIDNATYLALGALVLVVGLFAWLAASRKKQDQP